VDEGLGKLKAAVEKVKGIMVISADHGNADDMYEHDKTGAVKYGKNGQPNAKTAHSLNPVPAIVYDPSGTAKARLSAAKDLGISSLAATCIRLLGYEPPADYTPSIVDVG
jgi:2,3-bisphosphoglycerate-independent phosphoglycerate mutase